MLLERNYDGKAVCVRGSDGRNARRGAAPLHVPSGSPFLCLRAEAPRRVAAGRATSSRCVMRAAATPASKAGGAILILHRSLHWQARRSADARSRRGPAASLVTRAWASSGTDERWTMALISGRVLSEDKERSPAAWDAPSRYGAGPNSPQSEEDRTPPPCRGGSTVIGAVAAGRRKEKGTARVRGLSSRGGGLRAPRGRFGGAAQGKGSIGRNSCVAPIASKAEIPKSAKACRVHSSQTEGVQRGISRKGSTALTSILGTGNRVVSLTFVARVHCPSAFLSRHLARRCSRMSTAQRGCFWRLVAWWTR